MERRSARQGAEPCAERRHVGRRSVVDTSRLLDCDGRFQAGGAAVVLAVDRAPLAGPTAVSDLTAAGRRRPAGILRDCTQADRWVAPMLSGPHGATIRQ